MEYTDFGRTGLHVSVAGLGCGGSSRLGQARGRNTAQSVAIVGEAIGLGRRDAVVVSTKSRIRSGGELVGGAAVVANLEASLGRLGTDYVDVFHLHGAPPADDAQVRAEIAPAEMALAGGRRLSPDVTLRRADQWLMTRDEVLKVEFKDGLRLAGLPERAPDRRQLGARL
ncbi:MAG: aldo/keto reductase [Alphaproteobacteria bacterium]|nr:aldo/keto reductase [Alphaproteobacteria bacterium]